MPQRNHSTYPGETPALCPSTAEICTPSPLLSPLLCLPPLPPNFPSFSPLLSPLLCLPPYLLISPPPPLFFLPSSVSLTSLSLSPSSLQVDNKLANSHTPILAYPTPPSSGEPECNYPVLRISAEKLPHKSPFAIVFKVEILTCLPRCTCSPLLLLLTLPSPLPSFPFFTLFLPFLPPPLPFSLSLPSLSPSSLPQVLEVKVRELTLLLEEKLLFKVLQWAGVRSGPTHQGEGQDNEVMNMLTHR